MDRYEDYKTPDWQIFLEAFQKIKIILGPEKFNEFFNNYWGLNNQTNVPNIKRTYWKNEGF